MEVQDSNEEALTDGNMAEGDAFDVFHADQKSDADTISVDFDANLTHTTHNEVLILPETTS